MQIETPPVSRDTPKPQGERRGLVLVHTGHGKGKRRRPSVWPCAHTAVASR